MRTSRSDRWSALDSPEAVQAAAERLRQLDATDSEGCARQRWLTLLAPQAGERILDVGAGTGHMAVELARHLGSQGSVHALDLSPGLLQYARRAARQAGVLDRVLTEAGDARALPYRDGGFDAAFCRWVLLHLPDPQRAVAEMRRVVRPGGRILCVEADWETLAVYPGDPEVTRRVVQANVDRQVDGRVGRRLVALLRAAGLQAVSALPVVALDLSGDWLPFLRSRLEVAVQAGMPTSSLTAWWKAIEAAAGGGEYLFSFTQYGVIGTVPSLGPRRSGH